MTKKLIATIAVTVGIGLIGDLGSAVVTSATASSVHAAASEMKKPKKCNKGDVKRAGKCVSKKKEKKVEAKKKKKIEEEARRQEKAEEVKKKKEEEEKFGGEGP